ncbi:branched-chain amino acid ABC transporter permease [Desertimonas flava]|uniref:branched-chain amino acid ABC transporter permease n=1 Tax=Desertimonas flava TaxID=2064846 RepID=UPI000E356DFC|nr:branched-chain amino acid ABC transporter permease [Desertimonas flava]
MHWINLIIAGLCQGAVYAALGMGYNIIFATTHVMNFAQGEMFMAGGMLGALFVVSFGLPLYVAFPLVILATGLIGAVEERLAVRPALRRTARSGGGLSSQHGWLLSTLGAAIILRSAFSLTMGSDVRRMPPIIDPDFWGVSEIGGLRLEPQRLLLLASAIAAALSLGAFYSRRLAGQALMAIAQDREAARLRAIPVERYSMFAFALGSALAGAFGFITAPITSAFATIGLLFALKGFIACAVGGIPSIRGTLVGGLLLGVVESAGADIIPNGGGYQEPIVFTVLIVFLVARPGGLTGRAARAV